MGQFDKFVRWVLKSTPLVVGLLIFGNPVIPMIGNLGNQIVAIVFIISGIMAMMKR